MPTPTGIVSRTTSHAPGATARSTPNVPIRASAPAIAMPVADPTREVSGHRREQAHAEHRDRAEQTDDGMRRVEVVLDLRDQRPDADDLGSEREGGEEEGGERRALLLSPSGSR